MTRRKTTWRAGRVTVSPNELKSATNLLKEVGYMVRNASHFEVSSSILLLCENGASRSGKWTKFSLRSDFFQAQEVRVVCSAPGEYELLRCHIRETVPLWFFFNEKYFRSSVKGWCFANSIYKATCRYGNRCWNEHTEPQQGIFCIS